MERPSSTDEAMIGVSMERGRVIVRPVGRLDDAAAESVHELLEGARAAGYVAVVDFTDCELDDQADQAALSTSASAGR